MNIFRDLMTEDTNERMLLEMAKIGVFDSYAIFVRSNDNGKIPHFHILDSNSLGNTFHTCIKIECAEYFHHEGKRDVLNSEERKELVKFLRSQCRNIRYKSNWEYLLSMWNDNAERCSVDENQPMPDYNNLI